MINGVTLGNSLSMVASVFHIPIGYRSAVSVILQVPKWPVWCFQEAWIGAEVAGTGHGRTLNPASVLSDSVSLPIWPSLPWPQILSQAIRLTGSPRTLPSGGGGEGGASICLLHFLTAIQGCGRSSSQGCLVTAFASDEKKCGRTRQQTRGFLGLT